MSQQNQIEPNSILPKNQHLNTMSVFVIWSTIKKLMFLQDIQP